MDKEFMPDNKDDRLPTLAGYYLKARKISNPIEFINRRDDLLMCVAEYLCIDYINEEDDA